MTETPGDRIRKLLLRADRTLRPLRAAGPDADQVARARLALEEALEIARDPDVPVELREQLAQRLDGLTALDAPAGGPAGAA